MFGWGKMFSHRISLVAAFVVAALVVPMAGWAGIGTVLEAQPGVIIIHDGRTHALRTGMEVDTGDIIRTNGSATVQLLFADNTKMAVGPNSELRVDVSLMRNSQRADSFVVNAIGGSFRFMSGDSAKSAYEINTPTATMGVRGTIFDVWIDTVGQSYTVILHGAVQMCSSGGGGCMTLSDGCQLGVTNRHGQAGSLGSDDRTLAALRRGFPFINSQTALRPELRTNTDSCSRYQPQRVEERRPRSIFAPLFGTVPAVTPTSGSGPASTPGTTSTATPTTTPTTTPSATPTTTASTPTTTPSQPTTSSSPTATSPSSAFPGQSGTTGPSEGKGGGASGGQDGSGTGSGQGASQRSSGGGKAARN